MPAECTVSVPLTRTPWFDATEHAPAREGHYEVRYRLDGPGNFCRPCRRRWAAGTWQFTMHSQRFGVVDGDQWRGLMPADDACPKCGNEEWDHVTAERGRECDVPFNYCPQCDHEWKGQQ